MAANGPSKPAGASLPLLAVADRAELRAWLEHNDSSSTPSTGPGAGCTLVVEN